MKYEYHVIDSTLTQNRPAFVKKVYSIVTTQLAVTTLVVYLARVMPFLMQTIQAIQIISLLGVIISTVCLTCGNMTKKYPQNFIFLAIFTISEAFALTSLTIFVSSEILLSAFAICGSVTAGLTLYAMTTKKDFSLIGASGVILLTAFSVISLIHLFVRSALINSLYLFGGAVVYGFYLVIDTQRIMGGKAGEFDIDDYILASINLYLDIIQLLIKIIQILQSNENNKKKEEKK